MVYQAEKLLNENKDKVPEELKADMEQTLTEAKGKTDGDLDTLKSAQQKLETKLNALSQHVYSQQGLCWALPLERLQTLLLQLKTKQGEAEDVVDAEFEDQSSPSQSYSQ